VSALRAISRRLDAPLLVAAAVTSGLKILSAGLNYALLILLARFMSVDGFGLYGVLFSAATLIAGFLSCGQPVLVLKSIPQYEASADLPRQRGVILFGAAVLAATSALFVLVMLAAAGAQVLPASLADVRVALAFGALTVIYAVSDYTCNLLRALGHAYEGLAPRDVLWRLATCIGVTILAQNGGAGILEVLALLALSLAALVGWQIWRISCIVRRRLPRPALVEAREWRTASVWMAVGSLLFVVSMTLDTVLVGALLGTEDAAIYFAAARTAGISALLLVGLRLIAAPVFARLHYGAEAQALRSKIEMVYLLSATTAALLGLTAFVLAPQIMSLFGAAYLDGVLPFRVLLIGLCVATAGGMSSAILESTGGERLNAIVLLVTQSATVLAVVIGAWTGGLLGAAIGKALGVAAETLWLSGCVFIRLRTVQAGEGDLR
jgi:O-antigen/teichoic acid export membrane protein